MKFCFWSIICWNVYIEVLFLFKTIQWRRLIQEWDFQSVVMPLSERKVFQYSITYITYIFHDWNLSIFTEGSFIRKWKTAESFELIMLPSKFKVLNRFYSEFWGKFSWYCEFTSYVKKYDILFCIQHLSFHFQANSKQHSDKKETFFT